MAKPKARWKSMTLQEVVDFVEHWGDKPKAMRMLGITQPTYSMCKWLIINADIESLDEVNSNMVRVTSVYRKLKGIKNSTVDYLSLFSTKARESIGDVAPYTSHLIKWGLVNMEMYIDHYLIPQYMKKTQETALLAHYWLMYDGHPNNYLQMRGVAIAYREFKATGMPVKRIKEILKQGLQSGIN